MSAAYTITLPQALFATAESASFEGAYEFEELEVAPDVYRAEGAFPYQVTLTNVGGAILVEGTVEGTLTTPCARCLEECVIDVQGEVEGYFIIPGEGEKPEDMDDDEFDMLPDTNEIDLEPLLKAGIIIEVPLVPLCREDCQGLCPQCGKNLNEGPCDCDEAESEPYPANNPFAVLKNLELGEE